MAEPEGDVKKGVEGLAQDFVATLGLLDLIFGGLLAYCLWLFFGRATGQLFPTTGIEFVDIALLAGAAALLGRLVSLLAATLMAVASLADERYLTETLAPALDKFCDVTDRPGRAQIDDIADAAAAALAAVAPAQSREVGQIRTNAILAFGAALLAIPYAIYFARQPDDRVPRVLTWGVGAGGLLILVLAVLQQRDYYRALQHYVRAFTRSEGARAEPRAGSEQL